MGKNGIHLIITVAIIAVVMLLVFLGGQNPRIEVTPSTISIYGIYGIEIPMDDITSISLDKRSFNEIAPRWRKTNGFDGFTGELKGHFSTSDLGNIILYVNSKSAPTILIERAADKNVYISLKNPEDTQLLYDTFTT